MQPRHLQTAQHPKRPEIMISGDVCVGSFRALLLLLYTTYCVPEVLGEAEEYVIEHKKLLFETVHGIRSACTPPCITALAPLIATSKKSEASPSPSALSRCMRCSGYFPRAGTAPFGTPRSSPAWRGARCQRPPRVCPAAPGGPWSDGEGRKRTVFQSLPRPSRRVQPLLKPALHLQRRSTRVRALGESRGGLWPELALRCVGGVDVEALSTALVTFWSVVDSSLRTTR